MAGVVVNFVCCADLHDVACVHHRHPVGKVCHHTKVVGDEHDGQVVLCPHLPQQLQNLRLNGHIQRGGGLIAEQNFRVARQRNGNDHPLPHSAGEFVGVLLVPQRGVRDAHVPQVFQRLFPRSSAL